MKKTSFKLFALALAICCIVTLIPLITFATTSSGALEHVYTKEDDSILLGTDLTTTSSDQGFP